MDIDFHFGTVYVLSRWAGFQSANAKVIAASSQFVDDNIDNIDGSAMSSWSTGCDVREDGRIIRYSGHDLWANIGNTEGNEEIWIPYHFLPGLEGETEEEKLICHKNSVLAKKLEAKLSSITTADPNWAFKLGIGLHVFADTWAHQEFAGIFSLANVVHDLVIELFDQDNWKSFEHFTDMMKTLSLNVAAPLGHAAAINWPDRPYAKWSSSSKFPGGRDNCQEFLEAAEACYGILAKVSGDVPEKLQTWQLNALKKAFLEIVNDDPEIRNKTWAAWIRDNKFGFDYQEGDKALEYSKWFILADETMDKGFYESIEEYYQWCKSELEAAGIYRLDG
ncbi:MAG: hypothetical protein Q4D21_08435 [Phascolarctobacterium sp.]|nr:hypothetical protein [Phascolarctobacterium sp.]